MRMLLIQFISSSTFLASFFQMHTDFVTIFKNPLHNSCFFLYLKSAEKVKSINFHLTSFFSSLFCYCRMHSSIYFYLLRRISFYILWVLQVEFIEYKKVNENEKRNGFNVCLNSCRCQFSKRKQSIIMDWAEFLEIASVR